MSSPEFYRTMTQPSPTATHFIYHLFRMTSFDNRMGKAVSDVGQKGWLVSILELGAWAGVLMTGQWVMYSPLCAINELG